MFGELYQFFLGIFSDYNGSLVVESLMTNQVAINGINISFRGYLAFLSALISETIIVVLCCLFIYRLIRLVGRLFSGGAL